MMIGKQGLIDKSSASSPQSVMFMKTHKIKVLGIINIILGTCDVNLLIRFWYENAGQLFAPEGV